MERVSTILLNTCFYRCFVHLWCCIFPVPFVFCLSFISSDCTLQAIAVIMYLQTQCFDNTQAVASRVAEEMGVKLGEEVGYTIRFEDLTDRVRIPTLIFSF